MDSYNSVRCSGSLASWRLTGLPISSDAPTPTVQTADSLCSSQHSWITLCNLTTNLNLFFMDFNRLWHRVHHSNPYHILRCTMKKCCNLQQTWLFKAFTWSTRYSTPIYKVDSPHKARLISPWLEVQLLRGHIWLCPPQQWDYFSHRQYERQQLPTHWTSYPNYTDALPGDITLKFQHQKCQQQSNPVSQQQGPQVMARW